VELSVAMLIALFLLGGVLAVEQSTRQTYGNQNVLAQLQDSQRLAMTLINDVIQSAGYFPDPTDPTSGTAAATLQAMGSFAQGQPITGTYGGGVAPGDTISIRYTTAPNDNVILCNGTDEHVGCDAHVREPVSRLPSTQLLTPGSCSAPSVSTRSAPPRSPWSMASRTCRSGTVSREV